ncbi:protein of unknown function [Pararobbsia alpina]
MPGRTAGRSSEFLLWRFGTVLRGVRNSTFLFSRNRLKVLYENGVRVAKKGAHFYAELL